MMTELTGHESAAELHDWAGSPMSTLHPAAPAPRPIRFEEYPERNRYVVRLELPGIDPGRDLQVSVDQHVLKVRAQRVTCPAEERTPEPPAGTYSSAITLPAGADDRDVAATYRNGILEVSAGWQADPAARTIKVLALADVL